MLDTIVALSTPPGTSGLAILRLSGPACRDIVAAHLGRSNPQPRHVYYGAFRVAVASADPGSASGAASGTTSDTVVSADAPATTRSGEILDRLNFVHFPSPGSSTGEDVLELYPHGNMLLADRILKVLLDHPGVRMAGPGEFTRRSFENGKIDLLQAEAVGQLIHAQTLEALRNAQRIAAGDLSAPLKALRDSLVDLSVRLELDVDFSEEEADPDYASWMPRLESVLASLKKLASGFAKGRGLARAPRVVILGAPNAGKSSLINALVEEDRLLVSEIPGTTRDYVEVTLRLPNGLVHLVDTAGLGKPVDGLDKLAMERTRKQSGQADLRIWVQDGTTQEPTGQAGTAQKSEGIAGTSVNGVAVPGGKVDANRSGSVAGVAADGVRTGTLAAGVAVDEGRSVADEPGLAADDGFALRLLTKSDLPGFQSREGYLAVSNRTRAGLEEFRTQLDRLVFRDRGMGEDIVLTTERQFRAVEAARERVEVALQGMRGKPAIEILAFEIREAAGHLQELLGEISTDEILGKIFSGFCIGK